MVMHLFILVESLLMVRFIILVDYIEITRYVGMVEFRCCNALDSLVRINNNGTLGYRV